MYHYPFIIRTFLSGSRGLLSTHQENMMNTFISVLSKVARLTYLASGRLEVKWGILGPTLCLSPTSDQCDALVFGQNFIENLD